MRFRSLLYIAPLLALTIALAAPASASRFGRVGLDYLVAENDTVVVGEVLETHSYWTKAGFILTDAKVAVADVLKGDPRLREVTVTLPGGSVGEKTVLVVGAAALQAGRSYVLFLRKGNLPGVTGVQTVRDHSQGVFEIADGAGGPRVVSQANGHALIPDAAGVSEAPGGAEGLPLASVKQAVRELAARGGHKEVK